MKASGHAILKASGHDNLTASDHDNLTASGNANLKASGHANLKARAHIYLNVRIDAIQKVIINTMVLLPQTYVTFTHCTVLLPKFFKLFGFQSFWLSIPGEVKHPADIKISAHDAFLE